MRMRRDPLRDWKLAALAALLVLVLAIPLYVVRKHSGSYGDLPWRAPPAGFVGREKCIPCHKQAYEAWKGSHHDHSMAIADSIHVRGDFDDATLQHDGILSRFYRRDGRYYVHTEGPGGEMDEFEVAYTFGWAPLQQYLIPFSGGRLQALSLAWDVERGEWFDLYADREIPPGDWLHWTRNGQNWNGMCAECHSTNLRKGFDPATQSYTTSWSEIDVSCETCHGPGSRHVAWAEIPPMARPQTANDGLVTPTSNISARQLVELCAPCHSRRSELGDYDHTRREMLDFMLPTLLSEGLYHADGQIQDEVYVYGSFVQSKMFGNDVRCSDCHDSHSLKLAAEGNELCLKCHRADTYDIYDHHFHKKVHEGQPSPGAWCVKCHLMEQPYMVIDWRADHSFRVPRPDLTSEIGTPNACTQPGCHDDKPLQWSLDAYRKWYGLARKPQYGTTLAAGRTGDPEAEPQLVRLAEDPLYPAIVRATAASLLTTYTGEAARATHLRLLFDDEPLIRHTALQYVDVPEVEALADLVAPFLSDSIRAVRTQAVYRLSEVPLDLLEPYQREAFSAVLAEYEEMMAYVLDFSHAGLNLGNLYGNLGRPAEAERYYRDAIAVDDLFYPARVNLAMLLNQQGRNDEAEEELRAVVAAYPDHHDVTYSLGLLLVEMSLPGEAMEFLERAAAGLPSRSRVHYNLGLLRTELGRDEGAEEALSHALSLEPTNPDYLYALADFYVKRARWPEALRIAERMIATHPDAPIGPDLKRQIEQRLRRTEEGR